MNREIKRLGLGLLIWFIPLFISFFMWDVNTNSPSINLDIFKGLMGLLLGLGLSIAIYYWFKDSSNKNFKSSFTTGAIWFVQLCLLDLIILVGLFGSSLNNYLSIVLMYLTIPLIMASIGLVLEK